jgi:hypothetical protein
MGLKLRYSARLTTFGLSFVLAGCIPTIVMVNCLDAKVARAVKPDRKRFHYVLEVGSHEPRRGTMVCEEFYSTQCSERGNYWTWREVGLEDQYAYRFEAFSDPALGLVEIRLPRCTDFVKNRDLETTGLEARIGGLDARVISTDGPLHVFRTRTGTGTEMGLVRFNLRFTVDPVAEAS